MRPGIDSPLLQCLIVRACARLVMKKTNIEAGRVTRSGRGLGTVTKKMVRALAREIAKIAGRWARKGVPVDFTRRS